MITKSLKNLLMISVVTVIYSSCSFGGNDIAMSSVEGIAKVKELVKANVNLNEFKIYHLSWEEGSKDLQLTNILGRIEIRYIDKDGNSYSRSIVRKDGKYIPEESKERSQSAYSYKLTTGLDLEKIDPDQVRQHVIDGAELSLHAEEGDQYEFKTVKSINFKVNAVNKSYEQSWEGWSDKQKAGYNQVEESFELNFIKKGEKEEVYGKKTWTNYYTVPFVIGETGKVEMKQ